MTTDWETTLTILWQQLDTLPPETFITQMDALTAQCPAHDGTALFEQACARDSLGLEAEAVALYQKALQAGLTGLRRRRAGIQLASSLRNVGRTAEGLALLDAERAQPSDELDDALSAFRALMLVDLGREREAVAEALTALAPHLPRYQRSVRNYAHLLTGDGATGEKVKAKEA